MGRVVKDAPLTTRNARAGLARGIHWRSIVSGEHGVHLGYRRGARSGHWLVRWRVGASYHQAALGAADDALPADGQVTLSYLQAEKAAREQVDRARKEATAAAAGPVLSVADAIEEYCTTRDSTEAEQKAGRGLKRDARSRLNKHVLRASQLGGVPLHLLSESHLADWRKTISPDLAIGTRQRLLADLKAALNAAAKAHRAKLPAEFSVVVKNGLAAQEAHAPEARRQILTDAEVRAVVAAAWAIDARDEWGGDLARLVLVLASTGARFSQIARLTVADVQPAQGRLMVPPSRKGRGRKASSRIAVPVGEDVLAALRPAIAGRKSGAPLLERWRMRQTGPATWERDRRGPWHAAAEMTRAWAAIIAEAGLPGGTIPYCLRHSSIVRGLRAGLPTRLVAALHDTSSAMIERHYSAFIADALGEIAARAVIRLDEPQTSRVVALVGGRV